MRHYAKNSPQAAARFLVVTALADGELDRVEFSSLHSFPELRSIGVDAEFIDHILAEFCEDLGETQRVDGQNHFELKPPFVTQLLADIDDPDLRLVLGRAALEIIGADAKVHRGEAILLCAALDAWDLHLADLIRRPDEKTPLPCSADK